MSMSKHEAKSAVGCHRLPWAVASLWLVTNCGPADLTPLEEQARLGSEESALVTTNSLTPNGLSLNGLSLNGLSLNGLSLNGLATSTFSKWFNSQSATVSNTVMKYVVHCAVASGETRTWTNPSTGVSYTWSGGLGLTPSWAGGEPTTELEEQLISACLAAHVNKYGVTMQISLVGRNSEGTPLATSSTELKSYTQREASFYGNLFRGEGVYACKDPDLKLSSKQSTLRACAIDNQTTGANSCSPIVLWGACGVGNSCQPDSSKQFYSTCSYNGKAYQVLSTRIRPQDVYTCGDGVCQISESCGTSDVPSSCGPDCGPCQ